MVELIASILFIGSATGVAVITARKMPAANQLPERAVEMRLASVFGFARNWVAARIKKTRYFKDFSWIDFMQKQLLKTRVVVMKAENKINDYTLKLRQRAEDQKGKEEALLDNYWHDLKTIVKTKNPLVMKSSRASIIEPEVVKSEERIAVKTEETKLGGMRLSEPMIKVVMPEEIVEKPAQHHKKKRAAGSKKKRFRDPFSW